VTDGTGGPTAADAIHPAGTSGRTKVADHGDSALILLEKQLQPELNNSHRRSEAPDLSHPRRIRRDRVNAQETCVVRIAKVRSVECIERFGAELKFGSLGKFEILEHRKIEIPLAEIPNDSHAGISVMAQVGPARNVAGRTLEGQRII
jgi:hypothetical protein